MFPAKHDCAITSQIKSAKDDASLLMNRVRAMEDRLESPNLPEEQRILVERELAEIRKLLNKNQEILSQLHKENSKSYAVAASLMFLCFLLYGIYCMLYGR